MKISKAVTFLAAGFAMLMQTSVFAAPPASSVNNLWRLVFEDNFDGTEVNTNAWTITDACGASICRHPENVEVSGGTLKLNTLAANALEDPPEVAYTTGRIDSGLIFGAGYTEVSARAAEDSGVQSSMFSAVGGGVLPNILQTYEGDSNDGLTDWTFINGIGGASGFEQILDSGDPFPGSLDLSDGLRVYGRRWTEANEIIWNAAGSEIGRAQAPLGVDSSPVSLAIGSAVRDEDFGIPRDPIGTSMEVDYVRYYAKRDICLGCDSFNYGIGSLDGASGGGGWSEPWSVTSGDVDVEGLGNNLGLTGVELPGTGGDRALGNSGAIAVRELASPINVGANTSYYVSMLVRKDDAGDFQISFRRFSDGAVRWFFGGNASESAFVGVQSTASVSNAFPADETVLVLARYAAVAAGTDTVNIAVYRDGDLLPESEGDISWTASGTGNSGIIMDFFDINVYGGNVEIDEIKIGTSLADVLSPTGAPDAAESFDYADADLDTKNGGTGWNDAWIAFMSLSNDDNSLAYPQSPSTETITGSGDKLVLSDGVAERGIADSFSLAEDNTYFMSFMAHKSSNSELLVEGLDAASNSRWRVGLRGVNEVLGGITATASSGDEEGGTAASLHYPASVAMATNGSRIEQSGAGSAYRSLSTSVPSSTEGAQRWVSFLARKSDDGAFNVRVASSSDVARWNAEVAADGTVRAEIFTGVNSAPGAFPSDETVLVVTEFLASSGTSDMVKIAVIGQGDPLPADAGSIVWDAEVTDSTSVTMNRLIVEVVTGTVELDEFRYGASYESVTTDGLTLFDSDGIDYSAGPIGGQGPWLGDLIVAGVPSSSLSYPALTPPIPFTPVGGRIDDSSGGSASLPLATSVFPGGGFTRWISFIAQKNDIGSFAVRTRRSSDGAARWNIEVNADGSVRSEVFGGTTSSPGIFPNDENVLVIARLYGDDVLDRADILLLTAGEALPASEHEIDTNGLWDVQHSETTSVTMNELVIESLSGRVQIDEWRYGSTYGSVTTSGGNVLGRDSFEYGGGPIEGNGGWSGDLNIAGPLGGFANDSVLVLSMFQAHAAGGTDSDMVYVKLFRSANELPASAGAITGWDLIEGGNTGLFLSKIRVTGTGPGDIMLDELKVGTTYASVTDYSVPGDCDGDGDVDADDYVSCFEPCLDGPGASLGEGCESADLDGDGDVDLRDYAQFMKSL